MMSTNIQETVRSAEGALLLLEEAARGNVRLNEHNLQRIDTAIRRAIRASARMKETLEGLSRTL